MLFCIVKGCLGYSGDTVPLFRFNKNADQWCKNLNITKDRLNTASRVCGRHFESECIASGRYLRPGSMPTLNLGGNISMASDVNADVCTSPQEDLQQQEQLIQLPQTQNRLLQKRDPLDDQNIIRQQQLQQIKKELFQQRQRRRQQRQQQRQFQQTKRELFQERQRRRRKQQQQQKRQRRRLQTIRRYKYINPNTVTKNNQKKDHIDKTTLTFNNTKINTTKRNTANTTNFGTTTNTKKPNITNINKIYTTTNPQKNNNHQTPNKNERSQTPIQYIKIEISSYNEI